MTGDISRANEGPSSQDIKLYKEEYKHGVNLFQRALNEYDKADEIHKKEAFKEVMGQAMDVLNQVARELKNDKLAEQNQHIADDFAAYQNNPNEASKHQLENDLNKADRTV